jgi:lipoprotein NlpI
MMTLFPKEAIEMCFGHTPELPMKSKLFLLYYSGDEIWDYDAAERIMEEESLTGNDYWKWNMRFWLKELYINGLLEITAEDVDDGTHFAENKTITRYRVTDYGKEVMDKMLR